MGKELWDEVLSQDHWIIVSVHIHMLQAAFYHGGAFDSEFYPEPQVRTVGSVLW